MIVKGKFVSDDCTKGFVAIEEFKGQSTTITLDATKELVEFLKVLKVMGFGRIEIGVENDMPVLLFLNKEKTMALGFAPCLEETRE